MYRSISTDVEGPFVKAWWFVSYWQYTRLTFFGAWARWVDEHRPGGETARSIRRGSDFYVALCFGVAVSLVVTAALTSEVEFLVPIAAILGGYRLYEIVFSQLYFLLQSRATKVASFTRTLLFQGLFAFEAVAYASVIGISSGNMDLDRAVFEGYRSLTLQADTLVIGEEFSRSSGLAFTGANVAGIVILLGVLPLLIGALSGTWREERID